MSLAAWGALRVLQMYKKWFSPTLPASCKYIPSCSEYAQEAIASRGLFAGTAFAVWRLMRCNPLARGGFDPVPKLCSYHPYHHSKPYPMNEPKL